MLAEPAPAPTALGKALANSNVLKIMSHAFSNHHCGAMCQDCVPSMGFRIPRRTGRNIPPIPEPIKLSNKFTDLEPISEDEYDHDALHELQAAYEEEAALEWARSLGLCDDADRSAPPFGGHSIGR